MRSRHAAPLLPHRAPAFIAACEAAYAAELAYLRAELRNQEQRARVIRLRIELVQATRAAELPLHEDRPLQRPSLSSRPSRSVFERMDLLEAQVVVRAKLEAAEDLEEIAIAPLYEAYSRTREAKMDAFYAAQELRRVAQA